MSDIEFEIDGKPLKASAGTMIIQAADEAGISIPRFCYHEKLSIAANCRMCLVEVEKVGKPLPACATPITSGMKVSTKSPKAIMAQQAVMEFLLINHPLDCPICDQGGECELQDLAMGYGSGISHYNQGKRAVFDKDIGPLVETEMTRCIHCTRCVRFGEEIAGLRELGATGRGEHLEIGTYVAKAMRSEVSGNVIDVCPVGALTNKPFRFKARAWEMKQYPSVSPHDCLGSHLYVHTLAGKVMRIVPRQNEQINEVWLSDRDRFSCTALSAKSRLSIPKIKRNGQWQAVSWEEALQWVMKKLKAVIQEHGAEQIGALISPSASVEEFYTLQKLLRGLGSDHIDHRLRQSDFSDQEDMPVYPELGIPIHELKTQNALFLVGSHIQREQPVAGLHVRKAALNGADILILNPVDYDFNFNVTTKQIVAPHYFVERLTAMVIFASEKTNATLPDTLKKVPITETDKIIVNHLIEAKNAHIILGALAHNHSDAAMIRALAQLLATFCQTTWGFLTEGSNSAGAWLAGAVPHRGVMGEKKLGLHARAMITSPRRAYILENIDPLLDVSHPIDMKNALNQADFVVALTAFETENLHAHADVLLPMAAWTETSGTYVNANGTWQTVLGVANSFDQARPAWKILRVLGHLLGLVDFNYESSEEILKIFSKEMKSRDTTQTTHFRLKKENSNLPLTLTRIGEIPLYAIDELSRQASPLQETERAIEPYAAHARISPNTAAQYQLINQDQVRITQNESVCILPVRIDARIADHAVWIAGGVAETQMLGDLWGTVTIARQSWKA